MNISRSDKYRHRTLESRWLKASREFSVLLLTGPRQVGKTTLLEHLRKPGRRYVTLDDLALRGLARSEPGIFLQRFPPPVLIDEIQYAPELLPAIKMSVDNNPLPGAFWLTGSQQFHLMKGVTESLAGRVGIINLLGFSRRERDQRFSDLPPFLPTPENIQERVKTGASSGLKETYKVVWEGNFPALNTGRIKDRDLFYRSYVQTYLERDVRDLIHIGDLESFRRFLKACAARTAQMLNYTDLARDCGISVNTARNWMAILVASYQVFLLPPFHSNLSKRLYKTPKLYFLDTGLCAYLTEWSSPETLEAGALSGAILETYVFSEILKSWWHNLKESAFYYYRDKDGKEIDLLLEADGRWHPAEIKKTSKPSPENIKTFASLKRLKLNLGSGGLICLYRDVLPLDKNNLAIPVGCI